MTRDKNTTDRPERIFDRDDFIRNIQDYVLAANDPQSAILMAQAFKPASNTDLRYFSIQGSALKAEAVAHLLNSLYQPSNLKRSKKELASCIRRGRLMMISTHAGYFKKVLLAAIAVPTPYSPDLVRSKSVPEGGYFVELVGHFANGYVDPKLIQVFYRLATTDVLVGQIAETSERVEMIEEAMSDRMYATLGKKFEQLPPTPKMIVCPFFKSHHDQEAVRNLVYGSGFGAICNSDESFMSSCQELSAVGNYVHQQFAEAPRSAGFLIGIQDPTLSAENATLMQDLLNRPGQIPSGETLDCFLSEGNGDGYRTALEYLTNPRPAEQLDPLGLRILRTHYAERFNQDDFVS